MSSRPRLIQALCGRRQLFREAIGYCDEFDIPPTLVARLFSDPHNVLCPPTGASVRYNADIDHNTLQIEGGTLRAATSDLITIGLLSPAKTITVVQPPTNLQLPVAITTIAKYGAVRIDAYPHASPPDLPEVWWTDVVDVTFDVDSVDDGGPTIVGFDGPDFTTPPLTATPGRYRLRISAAHRDKPWIDEVIER